MGVNIYCLERKGITWLLDNCFIFPTSLFTLSLVSKHTIEKPKRQQILQTFAQQVQHRSDYIRTIKEEVKRQLLYQTNLTLAKLTQSNKMKIKLVL